MRFLFDTNIWIPLEPTSIADVVPATPLLAELVRLISESGNRIYLHPASFVDLSHDKNVARRQMRTQLLGKYAGLPDPPPISAALRRLIGSATPGTNDAIDDLLLAAVERDAVDYLVTADAGIHAKARRASLGKRVVVPTEALTIVRNLFPPTPIIVAPVRRAKAHLLDEADSIFDSFRNDYPSFNDWLRKCRQEARDVWMIGRDQEPLSALTILKRELPNEHGLGGPALKICSFKVADHARGFRYGELLLRVVFDEAYRSDVQWLYVTAFEKQTELIRLFNAFGFQQLPMMTHLGEMVLAKPVHPGDAGRTLAPLDFHVRFGPRYVNAAGVPLFVVPIQPKYHSRLFPEVDSQRGLFPGETVYGNSIMKAYLCHAPIRQLQPGHVLLFYRSVSRQARAIGVVEETLVAHSAAAISHFVGRRTVYDHETIRQLCARGKVLAILFRQAESLPGWINFSQLCERGVVEGGAANDHQSVTTKGSGVADQSNRTVALMSIKPEFAARILSGEKRVEFRKQAFRAKVSHVVIYSTTPVAAIVGVCEVESVFVDTPSTVWRKFATVGGIARAGFAAYYTNRRRAVAITVAKPVRFRSPVQLSSIGERRPPQSFRYMPAVSLDRLYAMADD